MRTMEALIEEALAVQNACVLSGVVHSFSRVMTDLRSILAQDPDFGTDKLNRHPICVLFASKIGSLTGYNDNDVRSFNDAYNWCMDHGKKTT